MSKPITQINYETVEGFAKSFHQESEEIEIIYNSTLQKMNALRSGWAGEAADKFCAEMEHDVLPSVKRLTQALLTSEATLMQILKIFYEADQETVSYYKFLGEESSASDNGMPPIQVYGPVGDVSGLPNKQGGGDPPQCPPGFPPLLWEHLPPEARAWVTENLKLYVMVEDGVNLRDSPNGNWIRLIPKGDTLLWSSITSTSGDPSTGDYEKWYKVCYAVEQADGTVTYHVGWIAGEYHGDVWVTDEEARVNEKVAPDGVTFIGNDLAPPVIKRYDAEAGEVVPVEPGTNGSQFIDNTYGEDNKGPKWGRYVDKYGNDQWHTGLCGQASIAAILNSRFPVSVNQIVDVFVTEIGGVPDYTSASELATVINEWYGDILHADYGTVADYYGDGGNLDDMPAIMGEWLGNGDYIIAGVGINGGGEVWDDRAGELIPNGAGHWVVITGIANDPQTDTQWVRIYNPFDNETEYYTWEDFKDAWSNDDIGYHLLHIENVDSPQPITAGP